MKEIQYFGYLISVFVAGLCLSFSDMKWLLCMMAAGLYLCLQSHADAGECGLYQIYLNTVIINVCEMTVYFVI